MEKLLSDINCVPFTLLDYRYIDGDMPLSEIAIVARLVRSRQPRTIFEIGTFEGGTTLQMAANCKADIFTLDLDPERPETRVVMDETIDVYPHVPGCRLAHTPYAPRITQLFGDSQRFDVSPYEGRMDLVFVDACHHYEWVKCDSENALKMVAPGGLILWHDYADYAPGVIRVLNELGSSLPLKHIADTSLVVYESPAAGK